MTDPDGTTNTHVYDAARRRVALEDAFGNTHVYTHDAVGNITAEADSFAGSTELVRLRTDEYDAANQHVRTLDADGNVTEYSYDANGRLSDTRDPLGVHTLSEFDPEACCCAASRAVAMESCKTPARRTTERTMAASETHRRPRATNTTLRTG